jgi:hypothetical protein
MTQKYVDLSSSATNDRILNYQACLLHLSDGTPVWLNTGGLYYGATDHSSSTLAIGSIGFGNGQFTMCRDSSDNLYVFASNGNSNGEIAGACFTKGAGYTWTEQSSFFYDLHPATAFGQNSCSAIWANTGGGTNGAGHILVYSAWTFSNGGDYVVIDAGAMQSGSASPVKSQGTAPSNAVGSVNAFDVESDGFSATSGLGCAFQNTTTLAVWSWSLSSTGALTQTSINSEATTTNNGEKGRILRYAANAYTLVFPSSSSNTHYAAARYSGTARLTAATDSGAPANLPLINFYNWDAFLDPAATNKVWLIAATAPSAGNQQIYRLGISVGSGVTWDAAVTTDDLLTNAFAAPSFGSTLRAVKRPILSGIAYVDWQVFMQTASSNYALDGDFTITAIAPAAKAMVLGTTPPNLQLTPITPSSIQLHLNGSGLSLINTSVVLTVGGVIQSNFIQFGSLSLKLQTIDFALIDPATIPALGDAVTLVCQGVVTPSWSGTVVSVTRADIVDLATGHKLITVTARNSVVATTSVAPFDLSDTPDNVATFGYRSLSVQTNQNTDGTTPTMGHCTVFQPGLGPGMTFHLTSSNLGYSAQAFSIANVTVVWQMTAAPVYQIEFGNIPIPLAAAGGGILQRQ